MSNRFDDDDFDRNVVDRNVVSRRYRGNINDRDINDYGQRNINRSDYSSSRYGNQSRYTTDDSMSGYYDDYGRDSNINRYNRVNQNPVQGYNQSYNQSYNRDRELERHNQNLNRDINHESDYGRLNQTYGYVHNYGQSYGQAPGHDMRDVGNQDNLNRDVNSRTGYNEQNVNPDFNREYHNFGGRDLNRDYNPRLTNMGNVNRNVGPHIGRGPKGYQRSDERIREEICEVFWRHDMIDASDIDVVVNNGEVTLTGSVDSRLTKRLAEDVLDNINGVRDVHNQLRVTREHRYNQPVVSQTNPQTDLQTSSLRNDNLSTNQTAQTTTQTDTEKTINNTQTRATSAK